MKQIKIQLLLCSQIPRSENEFEVLCCLRKHYLDYWYHDLVYIYNQIVWAHFKGNAKQGEVDENYWKLRRKNQDEMMAHKTRSISSLQVRSAKLGPFSEKDLNPHGGNAGSCRRQSHTLQRWILGSCEGNSNETQNRKKCWND